MTDNYRRIRFISFIFFGTIHWYLTTARRISLCILSIVVHKSKVKGMIFRLFLTSLSLVLIESKSKGIVFCSNNNTIGDAFASVLYLKSLFSWSHNFTVAHCNELENADIVKLSINSITNLNLCSSDDNMLNMTLIQRQERFRSWWCKPAALLMAPYDEVMLVDLDVVWFQNPAILFKSIGKLNTSLILNLYMILLYYIRLYIFVRLS